MIAEPLFSTRAIARRPRGPVPDARASPHPAGGADARRVLAAPAGGAVSVTGYVFVVLFGEAHGVRKNAPRELAFRVFFFIVRCQPFRCIRRVGERSSTPLVVQSALNAVV